LFTHDSRDVINRQLRFAVQARISQNQHSLTRHDGRGCLKSDGMMEWTTEQQLPTV